MKSEELPGAGAPPIRWARRLPSWFASLFLAALLCAGPAGAEGEVRVLLFYSEGCEHCRVVQEEVIPGVQAAFPLEVRELELGDPENYRLLAAFQDALGAVEGEVPVLVLGRLILQGEDEIREGLLPAVLAAVGAGGSPWPEVEAPSPAAADGGRIGVVHFFRVGCPKCDRTAAALSYLARRYPLEIRAYDASDPGQQTLHERYDQAYGVEEWRRLVAPAVYVGDRALVGAEVTRRALEAAVREADPASAPWERLAGRSEAAAARGILERYRGFGAGAVAAAGLLDGVNPCAFATLLFLLSYLTYTGRTRSEVLAVGALFTLGVFVTYLAAGLGLLAFLRQVSGFAAAARWVYLGTAALAVALAGLNLYDFALCLRGRARETTLQLSAGLKRRIHAAIRSRLGLKATAAAALATGAVVSVLELACTGQVYLPTLVYVSRLPGERLGALGYLVLYNLAFIAPLAAVFTVAYLGVSSRSLEGLLRRNLAWLKLGLAALFLTLAGLMLVSA